MQLVVEIPDSVKMDVEAVMYFRAFLQGMTNRRVQGAARYGDRPDSRQKYLSRLSRELQAYKKTGNFEQLLNIAVYAFLEGVAPQNLKFHFNPNADSVTRAEFGEKIA